MTPVQAAARIVRLQRSAALLGILYRTFDYESILRPFGDRMAIVMIKIFKDESS